MTARSGARFANLMMSAACRSGRTGATVSVAGGALPARRRVSTVTYRRARAVAAAGASTEFLAVRWRTARQMSLLRMTGTSSRRMGGCPDPAVTGEHKPTHYGRLATDVP
jgi:hypothetical protein